MEYIWENYGRMPNIEMAVKLSKTVPQVGYLLFKLGIRRKKEPPWSKHEEELLSELWGGQSISSIARSLGRTETAILVRAKRMRLGATKNAQGRLTANQLADALGVDNKAVYRWIQKHGLKCIYKTTRTEFKFYLIDIDDFWKWAEKNQDRFNSLKLDPLILGKEPAWVAGKRKSDAARRWPRKWTPAEDNILRQMFKTGNYTYQQIAERLGRTKAAVGHRLRRINVW